MVRHRAKSRGYRAHTYVFYDFCLETDCYRRSRSIFLCRQLLQRLVQINPMGKVERGPVLVRNPAAPGHQMQLLQAEGIVHGNALDEDESRRHGVQSPPE